jgi:hypothetical protein
MLQNAFRPESLDLSMDGILASLSTAHWPLLQSFLPFVDPPPATVPPLPVPTTTSSSSHKTPAPVYYYYSTSAKLPVQSTLSSRRRIGASGSAGLGAAPVDPLSRLICNLPPLIRFRMAALQLELLSSSTTPTLGATSDLSLRVQNMDLKYTKRFEPQAYIVPFYVGYPQSPDSPSAAPSASNSPPSTTTSPSTLASLTSVPLMAPLSSRSRTMSLGFSSVTFADVTFNLAHVGIYHQAVRASFVKILEVDQCPTTMAAVHAAAAASSTAKSAIPSPLTSPRLPPQFTPPISLAHEWPQHDDDTKRTIPLSSMPPLLDCRSVSAGLKLVPLSVLPREHERRLRRGGIRQSSTVSNPKLSPAAVFAAANKLAAQAAEAKEDDTRLNDIRMVREIRRDRGMRSMIWMDIPHVDVIICPSLIAFVTR